MSEEALDGGAESSGSVGRIRYRASWRQFLPLGLLFGALALMQLSNLWMWAHRGSGLPSVPLDARVLAVVLPIVFALELWMLGRYFGITLTPEAAIVHNLRRRTIPWTDVAEVAVEPFSGGRRVVLYETDGHRTPLRMPNSAFLSRDRRFDEKAATIRDWWLAHGGTDTDTGTGTAADADATAEPVGWGHTYGRLSERLSMRPAPSRSAPVALLLVLLAADALVAGFAGSPVADHPTPLGRALGGLVAIALLLGAGFLSLGRGVVLTSGHLAVRGLRSRTVPWDDIEGIVTEPHGGGRRLVLVETDGRRTPLPVPRVGRVLWDSEFESRSQTLRHWWHTHATTHTGPSDPATLEPSDRPTLLPYPGPRLWQKTVVTLVCVVLGYEILVSVLVGTLVATIGA
ncbi:hypothetical protein [Streptomyces sp. NPDC018036]|uniref:hypothetical protein n=1 Tax=Streptomyces sp. NPDC018036 TaxID=3365035 RepID=UPI0037A226EF